MKKIINIIRLPLVLAVSFASTFHGAGLSHERPRGAVNEQFDIVEIINVEEHVIPQNSDAPSWEFSGATKIGIVTILGSVAATAALWFCTKAHEQANPPPVPNSRVKLRIKKRPSLVKTWESSGIIWYEYSDGSLKYYCNGG